MDSLAAPVFHVAMNLPASVMAMSVIANMGLPEVS